MHQGRFQHGRHVIRIAGLFATGIVAFLILRAWLVPPDFGVYGFYRAGALDDARKHPIAFAGQAACEECHAGIYDPPDEIKIEDRLDAATVAKGGWPVAKEADNKHAILRCEACHGPLAFHVDDPEKPVAEVGKDALCMSCHREVAGRPPAQPQVVAGDHGENDPCISCHKPHRPRTDDEEGQ